MSSLSISTTTLGCPEWDLESIARNLPEYGFDAVDFRGLGEHLDVTVIPEFTTGIADTRRLLADAGLAVSCISSSIQLCVPEKEGDNLEEARRTIAVAVALDAPCVRVFGNGDLGRHSREALADVGAGVMAQILALDGAAQLRWCFETHDHWIAAADVRRLLERIPGDHFGVLWDVGHTPRVTNEPPAESWAAYGARVFNTHFKDAVHDPSHPHAMGDGWRYTLLGEGQLPLEEAVAILKGGGYEGCLTLEHEKRWHPDLPEPEVMFPHAARWFRRQLEA